MKDFSELTRKMKCKLHYGTGNDSKIHPFYTKTNFEPPPGKSAMENHIYATKIEISRMHMNDYKDNLTKQERKAIKTLKNKENVVIKKSYKNSTITILPKETYIKEANRQLYEGIHYEELNNPNTTEIKNQTDMLIKNMHERKTLDETTYIFLKNDKT